MSKQIDELKWEKSRAANASKEKINTGTMTQPSPNDDNYALSIDVNRLKADREFYQREYLKLKSRQFSEVDRRRLPSCHCAAGREDVYCMEKPTLVHLSHPCCECLTNARNRSKPNTRCEHEQQQIEHLKQKIRELESENKSLHAMQLPNKTMVNLLKEELTQLRTQIGDLTVENDRLQSSYNQLKRV